MSRPHSHRRGLVFTSSGVVAAMLFVGLTGVGAADYVRFLQQGDVASAAAWAGARSAVMAPPGGDREEFAQRAALRVLGDDSEHHSSHAAVRVIEDPRRGTLTVEVEVEFLDWAPFFPKPATTTGISSWPMPHVVGQQALHHSPSSPEGEPDEG